MSAAPDSDDALRGWRRARGLLALLLLAAGARAGVDDMPQARVGRLPAGVERPRIDADMDDPAWEHAERLGALTQVVPIAGATPSERTEVLLLRDDRGLFVALHCYDDEPGLVRGTQRARDANLDPDDRVELFLDPFLDRRNAFWFQIGPEGGLGDALITRGGSDFNKQWDGIWYGKARRTHDGWVAELEIPFITLNFDPEQSVWGFNLRRFIRRRNEEARWSQPSPRFRFFDVAQAGSVAGFDELTQGLGLDVVPFAVADATRRRQVSEYDDPTQLAQTARRFNTLDVGLDAFWRVTPQTKVSVSINTDFAQTEVDEQRVNLTRFPLFFPERRDFFLEDSSAFAFRAATGFGNDAVRPFFSRRIGIVGGSEVPIEAATKITGQQGGTTFGLLSARTGESHDDSTPGGMIRGRTLSVGRVSHAVGEQSDVGAIWTHGDPTSGDRAETHGVDANFRTNEFLGDRNLRASAWALATDDNAAGAPRHAWHGSVSYPNDEVDLGAAVTVVEEGFDPALGFVPRDDIRRYEARFDYNPRLNNETVRRLRFGLRPTITTGTDGHLQSGVINTRVLGVDFESDDELTVWVLGTKEVLDEGFTLPEDTPVDAGSYSWVRTGAEFETSRKRELNVKLALFTGGFFDGDRVDTSVELGWRPGPWGGFGVEWGRNDVSLKGGDFVTDVFRLRANWLPTDEVSWSNFLQYDSVSGNLGLNSRVRVILEPGRDFYFVINQAYEAHHDTLRPTGTTASAKVGWTFRY